MESVSREGLYIILISVHGLIRGHDLELGRDADTGGQTKYVVELARELGSHPDVWKVDLITRLVQDPQIDPSYAEPREDLGSNATLVRLPCGPEGYIRKELLWPHLDTFSDRLLNYIQSVGRRPDIVHSHYADAGYVASRIAGLLDVPMVHTGHSLGRIKRARLIDQGADANEIDEQYQFAKRIEAEETALDNAACVVASTRQEVDEQYSVYDRYQPRRMVVNPPGVDLGRFYPPKRAWYRPAVWPKITRFLEKPQRPMILALSRPDERKNIHALVEAYGESQVLRERANLVIIAGNRDDICTMEEGPQQVLQNLLYLVDRYDLYGQIAYPKHHEADDVPHLYRLAAKSGGIFINPALTEPFGLTLLEAAASGLPVVATEDGGPQDIVGNCKNGILVDPLSKQEITAALVKILSDRGLWKRLSKSGLAGAHRFFSWRGHANRYLRDIKPALKKTAKRRADPVRRARVPQFDRLIISDIDNTLLGDKEALRELIDTIRSSSMKVGFGVATGRRPDSAMQILKEWGVPAPDVVIACVGSEIYYGPNLTEDKEWQEFISYRWHPDALRRLMRSINGVALQARSEQRRFKISYNADQTFSLTLDEINRQLRMADMHANVIFSHGIHLDFLPIRASKGAALRFLALRWGMPVDRFLVAGDSGNDEEMLKGDTYGVVVGNYSAELLAIKGASRVYFAKRRYAGGIVEGIRHYNFLQQDQPDLDRKTA